MDIELLFSRNPFLQEGAAQFAFIRPVASRTVAVAAGQKRTTAELPPEFATKNVMVEALAGGVRKTQAYYANTLRVQMIESYGQLVVTQAETGKPVPGAYVKVYARVSGGAVNFIKDGYTDLRGRFDYVSLNTDEANQAERLAVLVMSDAFGAVVRETQPPKR
jgi:5-hydroxyisourate hydrolase-like protein (transthyretin family)